MGRKAIHIYVETIAYIISGYVFWIIASRLVLPEVVGTASALISVATITSSIAILGMDTGTQGLLSRAYSEKKTSDISRILRCAIFLVLGGILSSSVLIIIFGDLILGNNKTEFAIKILIVLMSASSTLYVLLYSILVSFLKTRLLPVIMIIASTLKVSALMSSIFVNFDILGLILVYTVFSHIIPSLALAVLVLNTIRSINGSKINPMKSMEVISKLLKSGSSFWIPTVITTIGSQIGTVVLLLYYGSTVAAPYFICIVIITGISELLYSLPTVALPAMSIMSDGRKRYAWNVIRLTCITTIPFTSLVFYSENILQVLGDQYIEGALSLSILIISLLPSQIMNGVTVLSYSYNRYLQILLIGAGTSVTKTILYFILIPLWGIDGAALSFTIGTVCGFFISIFIARKIQFKLFWKPLLLILVIPLTISTILSLIQVNFLIGIFLNISVSYILLAKLRIITEYDILNISNLLPKRASVILLRFVAKLNRQ